MALPAALLPGPLPSEIETVATSETQIQIVPLLSVDKARLLSGLYGPFRPPVRTTVPLWLALNLKRKGKCYIVPPDWMMAESLEKLLQTETSTLAFAEVPFHYVSIAKVILDVAPDDVPEADEVRAMLKSLREARQSKIAQGLGMINPYHLEMTNIAYAELCELRPFFSTAFSHLRAMRPPSQLQESTSAAPLGLEASLLASYNDESLGAGMGSWDRSQSQEMDSFSNNAYSSGRSPTRNRRGNRTGAIDSSLDQDSMQSNHRGVSVDMQDSQDDDDDDDDGMAVAEWGT